MAFVHVNFESMFKKSIALIYFSFISACLAAQDVTQPIIWSNTKLNWLDFKEKVTYDKYPYQLAKTRWLLDVTFNDTLGLKSSNKINFKVVALFVPQYSWVRNLKPNIATPALLQHEQTHFDLVELYARKLREKFLLANLTLKNYKREINKIKNKILRKLHAAQSSYDADVKGRVEGEEQNMWTTKTNNEIVELANFKSTTLSVTIL